MVWNDGIGGDHVFEKVSRVRTLHHVVLHPREGSGPRGFPVGPWQIWQPGDGRQIVVVVVRGVTSVILAAYDQGLVTNSIFYFVIIAIKNQFWKCAYTKSRF